MAITKFRAEEIGQVEVDLSSVLARLTISLTELLAAIRGAGTRDITTLETDVEALVGRDLATQTTLASLLTRADIALSAFQNAIRGAGTRDLTTLETDVEALAPLVARDFATQATLAALNTRVSLFDHRLQGAYSSWPRLNCRTITVVATANGQLVAANAPVPTGVKVVIVALSTNAGVVFIGDGGNVTSVDAAATRYTLEKGGGIEFRVNDLNAIRVRSSNGTERIAVTFENDTGT